MVTPGVVAVKNASSVVPPTTSVRTPSARLPPPSAMKRPTAAAADATRQATASITSAHRFGASSSGFRRRVVPVVRWRLEELLGLVGPELRDHRVGVDDAVLQPP